MIDTMEIGSSPADETCVQMGVENYSVLARAECKRFIALIIQNMDEPPTGAHLGTVGNPHDFGTYYEVAVRYNPELPEAIAYAFMVEACAPSTWDETREDTQKRIAAHKTKRAESDF